jgi:hypothetical protein
VDAEPFAAVVAAHRRQIELKPLFHHHV